MKQETAIHCLSCGANNFIPANKDFVCCSYCGGGIEQPYQRSNDFNINVKLVANNETTPSKENKVLYDKILNDPLVRSVFMPPKKPWHVDLLTALYNTIGLKGFAAIAFGLFVLYHMKIN